MSSEIVVTILLQSIAFIGALMKIFMDMKIKLKEVDIRLKQVEKKDDEIGDKLEKIFVALNDIKLDLKDKQDKQ